MNKVRKPLNEIIGKFNDNETSTQPTDRSSLDDMQASIPVEVNPAPSSDSLTSQLVNQKKKTTKIRFTLDLDKSLDDRLNKAAKHLNRHKSELARIALERLLDELEKERLQ